MKFKVNENCIGCGACTYTCEEVFEINDKTGLAEAKDIVVEEKHKNAAMDALESCPVNAISVEKEKKTE